MLDGGTTPIVRSSSCRLQAPFPKRRINRRLQQLYVFQASHGFPLSWADLVLFTLKVHSWKHRFVSECMSIMHDQAFGAKAPTYATVLQLDKKLRAFPVPPILQVSGFGSSDPRAGASDYPESVALILQRHIVLAIREMSEYLVFVTHLSHIDLPVGTIQT